MNPTRILLTATNKWPGSARLLMGFASAGHIMSIVCPVYGHPSRTLRIVHNAYPYRPFAPLDSLAHAIEAAKPDIIIPCDDLGVRHLHELHASNRARYTTDVDIPALIVRSLGAPESYPIVDSRYLLLKIAREEGIRTPETSSLESLDDLNRWHMAQPSPWVLKADGSTGGVGVRIAHTPAEARAKFSYLRRPVGLMHLIKRVVVDRDSFLAKQWWDNARPAVVAQSFIRGRPANCAVVCWNGEVLAGMSCEAVCTETSVGPATVVRLVDNAEMMGAAGKIARRLGLSGFFGLDFVKEAGTGVAYLIEMNPRCTPLCHLRVGIGRDMIGVLSARLAGEPLDEPVSVTQNDLIAYFPQALLRNSRLLSSSYHDIPAGESELIQELLRPWLNPSIISKGLNSLRRSWPRPLVESVAAGENRDVSPVEAGGGELSDPHHEPNLGLPCDCCTGSSQPVALGARTQRALPLHD